MVITYCVLHEPEQLEQIAQVESATWGYSETGGVAVPTHVHRAVVHCGGNIIGAWDGERLIGFTFGLPARRGDEWFFWSHMAAAHPDYQGRGIGKRLKLFQREWAIKNGYAVIGWTFDPLQRRNANFNLRHLSSRSNIYIPNFYGELRDALNIGIPSDRLEARWDLHEARVKEIADGKQPPAIVDVYPSNAFLLRLIRGNHPELTGVNIDRPHHFIEIPYDIHGIKRADMELAKAWRYALREVMQSAFASGYTVVDFDVKDGRCWYVLTDGA